MADPERFELSRKVSKTSMLPLHKGSIKNFIKSIVKDQYQFYFIEFSSQKDVQYYIKANIQSQA